MSYYNAPDPPPHRSHQRQPSRHAHGAASQTHPSSDHPAPPPVSAAYSGSTSTQRIRRVSLQQGHLSAYTGVQPPPASNNVQQNVQSFSNRNMGASSNQISSPDTKVMEFDQFLEKYAAKISSYGDLKAKAEKGHSPSIEKCLAIAKLLVKGLVILGDAQPILKVVSNAVQGIMNIQETYDSNTRIVYSILLEVADLLRDLFKVRQFAMRPSASFQGNFNVSHFMRGLASDIDACQEDIRLFLGKPAYMRIILVSRYEERFNSHAALFAKRRNEFNDAVNIHGANAATYTADHMPMICEMLRDIQQQTAVSYFGQLGGLDSVIGDDSAIQRALFDLARYKGSQRDIQETQAEYRLMSPFEVRVDAQLKTLISGVQNLAVSSDTRRYSLTNDELVNDMLHRCFPGELTLKSSKFALEFSAYCPSTKRQQAPDDSWMLEIIQRYPGQIADAYDRNASGRLDAEELTEFLVARPNGWSIPQWTLCWSGGLAIQYQWSMLSIQSHIGRLDKLSRKPDAGDFMLPEFRSFLLEIIAHMFNADALQDEQLAGLLKQPTEFLRKESRIKLKARSFVLQDVDAVKSICNQRIELWIFILVDLVFGHFLRKLEDQTLSRDNVMGFMTTQRSILDAFLERFAAITKNLQSTPTSSGLFPRCVQSYSCGIFNLQSLRPRGQQGGLSRPTRPNNDANRQRSQPPAEGVPSRQIGAYGTQAPGLPHSSRSQVPPFSPTSSVRLVTFERGSLNDSNRRIRYTGRHEPHIKDYLQMQFGLQDGTSELIPIWNPSPGGKDHSRPLCVGDIAYFDDIAGKFVPLFNLYHSPQRNFDELGLMPPRSHVAQPIPIVRNVGDPLERQVYFHNFVKKRKDTVDHQYTFETNGKQRSGNILILPRGQKTEYLDDNQVEGVRGYISQNALSWYKHAMEQGCLNVRYNGSLFLIGGTMTAETYGIASLFLDKPVSLEGLIFTFGSGMWPQHRWNGHEMQKGLRLAAGPAFRNGDELRFNQTLGVGPIAIWLDDPTWSMNGFATEAGSTPLADNMWNRPQEPMSMAASIRSSVVGAFQRFPGRNK